MPKRLKGSRLILNYKEKCLEKSLQQVAKK